MQIGSVGNFDANEEFNPRRRRRLQSAYDAAGTAPKTGRAARRGRVTGFNPAAGAQTEDEVKAPAQKGDRLPAEDTQRIAESFLTPEGRQETRTQKRMRDTTTLEGFMAAFDKVRVGRLTRGEEGNDLARQTAIDRANQRIKDGLGLDSEWVRNELRMLTQAQTDKAVDESLSAPFGPTEIGKTPGENYEPGPVTRFLSEAGQNLGKDVVRGYTTLVKGGAQLLGQPTAGITSEGFEETTGGQTAKGVAQAVPFFTPGLGQVSAAEGVFSGALDLASGRGLWKAVNQVVPVEMAIKAFDPKATTEERAAGLTALALLGHTAVKAAGPGVRSASEALGRVADKLRAASEPEARTFGDLLSEAVAADPQTVEKAVADHAPQVPEVQVDDLLKTVTKDAGAAPVSEVSPTSAQDVLPAGAKEPWQMTREELDALSYDDFRNADRAVGRKWGDLYWARQHGNISDADAAILARMDEQSHDFHEVGKKHIAEREARQAAANQVIEAGEPWRASREHFVGYHKTGSIESRAYERYATSEGIGFVKRDKYPIQVDQIEVNGKTLDIRQENEPLRYVKEDADGNIVRDANGMATYLPPEEMKAQGYPSHSAGLAVFDGDRPVGFASNEFGTAGVWVVDEFQGKGIGARLLDDFMQRHPRIKKIGQMTPSGEKMTGAYHKRLVAQALSEGKPVPPEVLADYPDLAQKYATDAGSSPIPTKGNVPEAQPTAAEPPLGTPEVPGQSVLSPDQGTIPPDAGTPREPQGVRGSGQVPEGEPLGIAHADTGRWRAENGLGPYVKTRYKVNQYSEEAVGRGHADNALSIADQVNSGQKTSADRFEQEGLRLGFHKVKLELKDIEAAKSDAIEAGDPAALAEAETAYQDAMGRGDRITKALDKVGSEAGGTLGGRAYDLFDEGDSLDLRRKVQSTTGEKVSAKDQARLDEVASKVKALEAEVDRLTKLAGDPNRIIRQQPRSSRANATGRAGRVSQADFQAAKDKLMSVVKPGALGAGFGGFEIRWDAEATAALRTYVRYVVQNTPGLRNLEQPYEGLKSKVQEMFGDIPDHLLRQAVVDELGSPRAVTREQMTARAKENAARRQARRAVTEIVEEAKDRRRTWEQKRARDIAGVLSVPRRMMTFLDDSAVGRQGLFLATTHPQAAAKAFVRQWDVVNKDGFDTVMGRIENDPLYHEFRGAGGYLADPLNGVREEGFVHSFLDKIPGLNKAMQGSEELMAAYLNVLRFESYKALRNGLSIGGHEPTVPELKWAAEMVNTASGRGGSLLGGRGDNVSNQVFFSPQMLKARFKMATGTPIVAGRLASSRAGALAAAEYAKYIAARAVLSTLLASIGGKTETDVKDKEFGQTRFGKLKVDTSGGMDASVGLVWGTIAQAFDREPAAYGKGVVDRVGRFLGNRLSPVAGYAKGAIDKKDFKGDPFQPGREAVKMLGPIHIVNQIDGSLDKEGAKPEDRAKMLILETFGFSTSFYDRSGSSTGPASPPKPSKPPSPPKPGLSRHRR